MNVEQLDEQKFGSWELETESRMSDPSNTSWTSNVSLSSSFSSDRSSVGCWFTFISSLDGPCRQAQLLVLPELQLVVDVVLPQLLEQEQQLEQLQLQQLVLHQPAISSLSSATSITSNVSLSSSSSSWVRNRGMGFTSSRAVGRTGRLSRPGGAGAGPGR